MSSLRALVAHAESRWQAAGWLLAAAFPVLALVVDKSASTLYAIFFLAGLWLLVRGRATRVDAATRWMLIAFAAWFFVGLASFLLGEQTRLGEKLLGRDIRFLGAVAVYFALARVALPGVLLRGALAVGGIVTGAVAVAEVVLANESGYRAGGETISIVFGHLSVMLFAVNLAQAWTPGRLRGLAIAGSLAAVVAVVLSGTRGALASVLVVTVVAGLLLALRARDRRLRDMAVPLGVAVVIVVVAGGGWLLPRFEDGIKEFRAYMQVHAPTSAMPARGCISDVETLQTLLRFSGPATRLKVRVIEREERMGAGCRTAVAIAFENTFSKRGYWTGPYRSLPEGAKGSVIAMGEGALSVGPNGEWIPFDAPQPARIELPAVNDVEDPRLRLSVEPGETLLLLPVETVAGEYGFVAAESSVGSRLAMWTTALANIDGSLLGRGIGSWPELAAEEAAAQQLAWRLAAYDHPHNDYLAVLVERGLLGLLALIAVFAAPLAWAKRAGAPVPGWRRAAVCLLVTAAAASALTETVFNHSIGITYYCALALLLVTSAPGPAGAALAGSPSDALSTQDD